MKDGDDVVVHVRESRHGPVLDDGSGGGGARVAPGHVLASDGPPCATTTLTLEGGLGLPEARDWASFVENLRNFHSPPQNISYADVDGNIGFLVPGRIPGAPRRRPRGRPRRRDPRRNDAAARLGREP